MAIYVVTVSLKERNGRGTASYPHWFVEADDEHEAVEIVIKGHQVQRDLSNGYMLNWSHARVLDFLPKGTRTVDLIYGKLVFEN